jgi:phosphoribosylglycinamide formyltransferase-1
VLYGLGLNFSFGMKNIFVLNIAIFASGNGSNAENIAQYFEGKKDKVTLLLTNNANAGLLKRARHLQIPSFVFTDDQLQNGVVLQVLQTQAIGFVVLAGFLKLIPKHIIDHYERRIVNIHPALLPKYGGKGMYGSRVHQAVKQSGDSVTGITIHYVNDKYDEGDIILQVKENVRSKDSVADIEKKVRQLEYNYYPEVIEDLLDDIRINQQ